jgi:hypothetical protein
MKISGKLVLFKIKCLDIIDPIICIMINGEVNPVADSFLRMVYDIHDVKERLKYFSKKKTMTISCDNVEETIDIVDISLYINGWQDEKTSGVDIKDSFYIDKKIREKLLLLINKEVTLTINI